MNRRTLCHTFAAMGIAAIPGRVSATATAGDATPQSALGNDSVCGQSVSLRLHETVTTGAGVSIRLGEIKDYRCSQEVECVWAGYAEIWLDLSGPDWEDQGYPTPRPSTETPLDEYEVGLVLLELTER